MSTIREAKFDKFTDNYFEFPVYVYTKKDLDKYDAMGIGGEEPDGVRGKAKVFAEDIVSWYDAFSSQLEMQEVEDQGFDRTIVEMKDGRLFTCCWEKDIFEDKLNKFMESKLIKYREITDREEAQVKKLIEDTINAPSPSFWSRLFGKK